MSMQAEAALLKAVADPYRLTMLATLAAAADEVCVCEFTDALPLNQPTVSHHLRILREAGLVTCDVAARGCTTGSRMMQMLGYPTH